jgi:biotin carboxyl carrier protein
MAGASAFGGEATTPPRGLQQVASAARSGDEGAAESPDARDTANLITVESPMVGTFYARRRRAPIPMWGRGRRSKKGRSSASSRR